MIAGVVATLDQNPILRSQLLAQVATRGELDVGTCNQSGTRIPITIDVEDRHKLEDSTTWLRSQPGVLIVDVVFVHFGEET